MLDGTSERLSNILANAWFKQCWGREGVSRQSGHYALVAAWGGEVSGLRYIYKVGMPILLERSGAEVGVVAERRTDLTLDLLTCPSSGISGSAAEVCVCACLPRHCGKELVTEVFPEVTSWERIREVTR